MRAHGSGMDQCGEKLDRNGAAKATNTVVNDYGCAQERLAASHVPEVRGARPRQCAMCSTIPTTAIPPEPLVNHPAIVYVGVHPRGFRHLALAELARIGAEEVDVPLHGMSSCGTSGTSLTELSEFAWQAAHCLVLFRLPGASPANGRIVELSTLNFVFELCGDLRWLPHSPTVEDVGAQINETVLAAADTWRSSLSVFKRWRATVHRSGKTQGFKSPEVTMLIGDALASVGAIALSSSCVAGPQVDLKKFDVEVVAFVSDGVDEIRELRNICGGESRAQVASRAAARGVHGLLALGVKTRDIGCRPVALNVEKGSVISRGDDTVALCVAQLAAEHLLKESAGSGTIKAFCALDPMCGVGTYLLALRWVLDHRGLETTQLVGIDVDGESVLRAQSNAQLQDFTHTLTPSFLLGSSFRLPLPTATVDLIVVDPPWGQRHATHTYVKRNLRRWAFEWARVMKPGGIAIVVTIMVGLMETQVIPHLSQSGVVMEESIHFDNKGWTQCRLFVLRKVVDSPTHSASCNSTIPSTPARQ